MKPLNKAESHGLVITLTNYIAIQDKKDILNSKTINEMANSYARFVEMATDKFITGQKEHGGKITNKKLELEIEHEMIDQFWYKEALFNWKK